MDSWFLPSFPRCGDSFGLRVRNRRRNFSGEKVLRLIQNPPSDADSAKISPANQANSPKARIADLDPRRAALSNRSAAALGVTKGRGCGVGRGLGVGVHLPVHGVAVAVGVGLAVGLGVAVGVGVGAQYLPPVFKKLGSSYPPQITISL